jgi:hypothetical protein
METAQTDRRPLPSSPLRQDKTSRWAFTAFIGQYDMFKVMPPLVAEWGWQTEICPETQREHYQGYMRTTRQVRFAQLSKMFPGVHIEQAKDWNKLLNYCKKTETAVHGSQQHATQEPKKSMTFSEALTYLASFYTYERPPDYVEIMNCVDKAMKAYAQWDKDKYWEMVNEALEQDRNLIGLYSQPQYMRSFENTSAIWLKDACLEAEYADHPDRQTDELPNNAFEN